MEQYGCSEMTTNILLIRHGETAWNREKVFRGLFDVPLNDNGRCQARLVANALKSVSINAAYTSPLSRSAETARIVLAPHGIEAVPHEGLRDFDYADWTGKTEAEVAKGWPHEHAAWISRPDSVRVPRGDSLQEVSEGRSGPPVEFKAFSSALDS